MGPALEVFVCHPAGYKCAYDAADDLGGRHNAGSRRDGHVLVLGEEGGPPVEDGEPYHIDAEVRHGQYPDNLVPEHHLLEQGVVDGLRFFFALLLFDRRSLKPVFPVEFVRVGKADGGRVVAQAEKQDRRAEKGQDGRNEETPLPRGIRPSVQDESADYGYGSRSYGMGCVPDGLLGGKLGGPDPMGHEAPAGGIAHALGVAVQQP